MACAAAIALATVAAGLPVGGAIRDTREKTAQTPPLAYDVDVAVDLDAGVWSGRETVRYVQRSRMPAREVVFNLYPNAGSVRVLNNREVMVCWPKCAKEPGSGT